MTMHKVAWYRGTALTGNKVFYTSRIPARWAKEINFLLVVEGLIGTAPGASLRVTPQIAAMHTRNQIEDQQFEAASQAPLWGDVTMSTAPGMLLDGRDAGEVATQAVGPVNNDGTRALVIPIRVAGGYWTRLALDVQTDRPDDPSGFQVSLEAVLR